LLSSHHYTDKGPVAF